tara:strand:- start:374 stop:931 length:558 start_codon:yes stop_codon:yes gene_type:complete
MDDIKLRFTDDIINQAKKQTPKKIKQKYVVDNDDSYKYGYVRFENNKLKSVYIYPNGYEVDDSWYSVLFKYEYQDNKLVFKYVYDFIEDAENETFTEGRYDENLHLESTYTHYDERVPTDDGKLFCTKEKDGKIIKYIFKDNVKAFPEYFEYLEKNNIIVNDGTHEFCFWGEKQDLDVTYLVITT